MAGPSLSAGRASSTDALARLGMGRWAAGILLLTLAPAPFLPRQRGFSLHLAEFSKGFPRACPQSSHARAPTMALCIGRGWLLRIWQRLARLLKQYIQHRGLVLWGEMGILRHPLAVHIQQIFTAETMRGTALILPWAAWGGSSLGCLYHRQEPLLQPQRH